MTKQIKSNFAETLRMTAAVFLMLLLGAISPAAISHVNAQTVKKETASSQSGGGKEGLAVHGHWVIDVRNPDGTLVTHRDFENELQATGVSLLTFVLARQHTVGGWNVILDDVGGNAPCMISNAPARCLLSEIRPTDLNNGIFKTLTVNTVAEGGPLVNRLVLSGNATAQRAGVVGKVSTELNYCNPDVTPQVCSTDLPSQRSIGPTTATTNFSPINVVSGQSIQVTVTISFS